MRVAIPAHAETEGMSVSRRHHLSPVSEKLEGNVKYSERVPVIPPPREEWNVFESRLNAAAVYALMTRLLLSRILSRRDERTIIRHDILIRLLAFGVPKYAHVRKQRKLAGAFFSASSSFTKSNFNINHRARRSR